jgi:hypothetical protein
VVAALAPLGDARHVDEVNKREAEKLYAVIREETTACWKRKSRRFVGGA